MDGLGHIVRTELVSDPDGSTYTASSYDGLGRTYQVWNPTRCSPATTNGESTWGYTTYTYDALGRTCVLVPPDGTAISGSTCPTTAPAGDAFTSYAGRATNMQDEGNGGTTPVRRISQVDGLGRLTSVCEVTGSAQLGSGGTPGACVQDISQALRLNDSADHGSRRSLSGSVIAVLNVTDSLLSGATEPGRVITETIGGRSQP